MYIWTFLASVRGFRGPQPKANASRDFPPLLALCLPPPAPVQIHTRCCVWETPQSILQRFQAMFLHLDKMLELRWFWRYMGTRKADLEMCVH